MIVLRFAVRVPCRIKKIERGNPGTHEVVITCASTPISLAPSPQARPSTEYVCTYYYYSILARKTPAGIKGIASLLRNAP